MEFELTYLDGSKEVVNVAVNELAAFLDRRVQQARESALQKMARDKGVVLEVKLSGG